PITATSPPMRIRLAAGLITVRSCPYWVCVSGCWACSDVTVASTTVNISCIRFISFLFAIRFMLFAVCIMLFAVCLFAMCFTLSRRQSAARKWQYLIPQHEPPLLVFPFPAYLDLCHVEVGPFFLLYRRPDEVLQSHRKLRGMHAVPGLIEPAILGFRPDEVDPADLDGYLERVLDRYFSMYLQIAFTDSTALLLNYADGPLPLLHTIATRCGVRLSNTYLEAATKRAGFDAKHPRQPFAERREPPHAAPLL